MAQAGTPTRARTPAPAAIRAETRDELQANIDEWQNDADGRGRRVVAAIKAATTQGRVLATMPQAGLRAGRPGDVELQGVRERRFRWRPQPDLHHGRPQEGRADGEVGRRQVRPHRRQLVRQEEQERATSPGASSTATASALPAPGRAQAWHHRAHHHHGRRDGNFAFTFKVTKTYKNYKVKWARSGSPPPASSAQR